MQTTNYLIVGGRSVASQSALQAIREFHAASDSSARIFATSSSATAGPESIEGLTSSDVVIPGIDLNDVDAADRIIQALDNEDTKLTQSSIDIVFFTPAFGPIGYPIRAATNEDAETAIQFSVAPMRKLSDTLQPRLTIGYSAFYWLPHARVGYGSMSYAKVLLDTLAHEQPNRFRAIRGGTFRSPATRGIGLLLQRALKTTEHSELKDLGAAHKDKGGKFSDFFFNFAFSHETKAFQERFPTIPHRATERADLEKATLQILRGEDAPVLCVIGDWIWRETEMPPLDPEVFQIKAEVLKQHGF